MAAQPPPMEYPSSKRSLYIFWGQLLIWLALSIAIFVVFDRSSAQYEESLAQIRALEKQAEEASRRIQKAEKGMEELVGELKKLYEFSRADLRSVAESLERDIRSVVKSTQNEFDETKKDFKALYKELDKLYKEVGLELRRLEGVVDRLPRFGTTSLTIAGFNEPPADEDNGRFTDKATKEFEIDVGKTVLVAWPIIRDYDEEVPNYMRWWKEGHHKQARASEQRQDSHCKEAVDEESESERQNHD